MAEQLDAVDFALAAYRDADEWVVREITLDHVVDVETLAHALRRFPADGGAIGLVAVDEDFFVVVRATAGRTRVLLSDVTAADEWEIAASAVTFLGLPEPDEDDDPAPAGELDLFADLGLPASNLAALIDDEELYPDEVLSDVARQLGFGELFDDEIGLTSA